QVDLDRRVRRDGGADVAALDDGVPPDRELPLALPHHAAHLRMARDDGDDAVDARAADRRGDVRRGDEDAAVLVELDGTRLREPPEPLRLVERDPLADREPRERAVHRARVDVAEAETLREPPRDGALAGTGGAIDRDDHA